MLFPLRTRPLRLAPAVLVVVLATLSCAMAAPGPTNVILLIGDGMGIGHVSSARTTVESLAMDSMPYTGLSITCPASGLVTDSAAAGTALATGAKTNNGVVAMDPEGRVLKTLAEVAFGKRKLAGLVTTKPVIDATPAAFIGHVRSRDQHTIIARQMAASQLSVILGGGTSSFVPKDDGGSRDDGRNLLNEAAEAGWEVFNTAEAMQASKADRILGLFAPGSMTTERPEPTLEEMTVKAIEVLSRGTNGFFLMSEGGQIDSYAHGNKDEGTAKQLIDFDNAVRAALEFAARDKRTLVVVTADHDTGGMTLNNPDKPDVAFKGGWSTGGHTGNMVPIYAYGPGAERFTGTQQNTEIAQKIGALWGVELPIRH